MNRGPVFTLDGFKPFCRKHQSRELAFLPSRPVLAYIRRVEPVIFGLTGGIGSGKSAVGKRLQGRGLPVVDADQLARLAVVRGSRGLAELAHYFGAEVLTATGELDRARLAERVFADDEARRALDSLIHPIVRELAAERFVRIGERGEPLVCYEVPLLYEVGLERDLAKVVVVHAPDLLVRARLTGRDAFNDAQIDARIAAQMPLADKVRRADYVIDNGGSLAELAQRTDAVFEALCSSLGVSVDRYPAIN